MKSPDDPAPQAPLPPAMRDRKPWPMWPIALSVVLFIAAYTFINVAYRKEGKAYEPFQAMMERKNAPIEKNMYDWYGIAVKRATDQGPLEPPLAAFEQGTHPDPLEALLPEQLKYSIVTKPILVPGPVPLEIPLVVQAGQPLRLRVWLPEGLLEDERFHLLAYYKEDQLYLLPALFVDKLQDASEALQGPHRPLALTLPTDPMEAERIHGVLLSEGHVGRWILEGRPPASRQETE